MLWTETSRIVRPGQQPARGLAGRRRAEPEFCGADFGASARQRADRGLLCSGRGTLLCPLCPATAHRRGFGRLFRLRRLVDAVEAEFRTLRRYVRRRPATRPGRPWFDWFSNRLKGYPDTLSLKCRAIPRDGRARPCIELEPTSHPLAFEQREGITFERLLEIYTLNGHDMRAALSD
jgi:Uncharacterized protein conserved in bacteria (DUF2199)